MTVKTDYIHIETRGFNDIKDITREVAEIIRKHNLSEGQATVFVGGSTGGVTTIEYEPGLLKDLPEAMEKLAPQNKSYHHDMTWHDGNGFSHVRAALQGPSLTVPFVNGKLTLGTWQQIVVCDFDNRSRSRDIIVQLIGE